MQFERKCITDIKQRKYRRLGSSLLREDHINKERKLDFEAFKQQINIQTKNKEPHEPLESQDIDNKCPVNDTNWVKMEGNKKSQILAWQQISAKEIALILLILFIITVGVSWATQSCLEKYQQKTCWKEDLTNTSECIKLEECIKQQQDTDYNEYFITFAATVFIILKKYWKEFIRLICNMNQGQQKRKS